MRFVRSANGAALPDIIKTEISENTTLLSSAHVRKLECERQILGDILLSECSLKKYTNSLCLAHFCPWLKLGNALHSGLLLLQSQ